MPATLTNPVHALLSDLGHGEIVSETATHTLAMLDAETFVVTGPDPLVDPAWLAAHLPTGQEWVTEWEQDGATSWVWITPADSSAR